MGHRWYVVRINPRSELQAEAELSRDGYEIFSPHIKALNPRQGQLYLPLFPGYLFLRWDMESAGWPTFRPGHRVTGWVRFENEVPYLADEVVAELVEKWDEINRDGGLWRRFKCGEKVRVVSGAIENLAEVMEEPKSPQGRVRVLMEFMGRLVSTRVPWEDLRSIEEGPLEERRAPRRTRGKGRWINGFGSRVPATV